MVELPMFNKARDERLVSTRKVAGPVAVVLFEGWRVGVEHPNFFGFNEHVDMLVSLTADLEAIFVQKSEAAARGVASSKVDMYAQYGGFGAVVDNYYRPIAQSLIAPVLEWSDVVLEMGGVPHHRVEGVTWRPGRWRAHQAATHLEELPAVVVGGGQAGLCCSRPNPNPRADAHTHRCARTPACHARVARCSVARSCSGLACRRRAARAVHEHATPHATCRLQAGCPPRARCAATPLTLACRPAARRS